MISISTCFTVSPTVAETTKPKPTEPPVKKVRYGKRKIGYFPAGKIAEIAVWRNVFLTIWHCILHANSSKTHSSSVTF